MDVPRSLGLESAFWRMTSAAGPTGIREPLIARVRTVLGGTWAGPDPDRSPDEQSAELIGQTRRAYQKVRERARSQYEAERLTSRRLRVFKAFARGEPDLLLDPWVNGLLRQAMALGDQRLRDGLVAALTPPKPKLGAGGNPQQAEDYYRWVVAQVSTWLLSGKAHTVSEAVRKVVLASDEAETRRAAAGLKSAEEDRARQIYYVEAKRYVWRVMVRVGVGSSDDVGRDSGPGTRGYVQRARKSVV